MSKLDFPTSPSLNQVFSQNGKSWIWDGAAWKNYNVLGVDKGGTGLTGIGATNAFLSSNSAGTALTYRKFRAISGILVSVEPDEVTFNVISTSGAGSGTVDFGNQYEIPFYQNSGSGTLITGSSNFTNVGFGISILYNTSSTSTSSGALTVTGGVGIGGSLYVGEASEIDGIKIENGVIKSGSFAGNVITTYYGGTGFSYFIKGDLLVGSGNSDLLIHPIGTNNYVLTADSTSATGVSWKVSTGTGTSTIGTPDDGFYNDGFFDGWTNDTYISNAMDDINELLKLIAPARPGQMNNLNLTASSVPTYYTAKISGGLGDEWYQAGYGTGTQITRYYLTGSHTLTSPGTATTFQAGTLITSTYGVIDFLRFNNSSPTGAGYGTIDLTENYNVGYTNNNLELTALDIYNNIWTKANARIATYTQATSGYEGYKLSHINNSGIAQTTNIYEVWRDLWSNSNPNPSYATSASASTFSVALKYLSGITYFTTGTGFSVYFSSNVGIYSSAYNTTRIFSVSATGLATSNWSPSTPPNYNDIVDYTSATTSNVGYRVMLDTTSQSSFGQSVSVTLFKASGTAATSRASIARYINTYTSLSSGTNEQFQDENYRLLVDQNVAWDSTTGLGFSDLQVRSGFLRYPVAADYNNEYGGSFTFTGEREYQRRFDLESASSGRFLFTGVSGAAVSVYGSGFLNMLLYLEGSQVYFDLGKPVNTGSPTGASRGDAFGGQKAVVGTGITFSIGTFTTGTIDDANQARFRLIVIYRNSTTNPQITRLQLFRDE